LTTLYIRYPSRAGSASGSAPACPYALAGDGGHLLQQGASALGNLGDLVASAQRVVLLLAASDVTLLRVQVPPLSASRLKAALPNLVEDQLLGDIADAVMVAGPSQGADGMRSVAVVQRAWLELLVKALVAQGAHSVSALPAQLCLPFQPGAVSAALGIGDDALELTMRQSQYEGLGLTLAPQPEAALHTLRAMAGEVPVTLYLPAPQMAQYALAATAAKLADIALVEDHWAHWISAAKSTTMDLVPALGGTGAGARQWQRWRWPLRLAVLALVVNIVGINSQWLHLRHEAAGVRAGMLQTFKAAYPNETVILDPAAQMRKNIAVARAGSGEIGPDEFTALSAALGEALGGLPRKDVIATLEYRERALLVKIKPNMVDAAAMAQIKAALAARKLELSEATPGTWRIQLATSGSKS
jgi:general secretion pathway protein L